MNFSFKVEVGILARKKVRDYINDLKNRMEFKFPPTKVLIIEHKTFIESTFEVMGKDLTHAALEFIKNWDREFKSFVDNYA